MQLREMIAAHPHVRGDLNAALADCAAACFDCAPVCLSCADACLGEEMVTDLIQCIRLDQDCADLCLATGALALRRSGGDVTVLRPALETCELACRRCAEECEGHAARHDHCRICAETCRACERACRAAIDSLPASGGMAQH